jgi:pimeloyl-ACP methyl ester carboxylesterase
MNDAAGHDAAATPRGSRLRRGLLAAYLVLLAASLAWQAMTPRDRGPLPPGYETVTLSHDAAQGGARLAFLRWRPEAENPTPARVLLLHGSPGDAGSFNRLGSLLAQRGYEVLAPDLPGFGASEVGGGMSILAHARAMLEFTRSFERVHVVGWSNGAGVALHMADLEPDRLASVTLLAGIGSQRDEGSGSYGFEHAKYATGFVLAGVPDLIPHFGLLGTYVRRTAWLRNFWETDQRPLEGVMARLSPPTLILHGRHDPLVPVRTAERSHRLIPTSRLVVLDASHFLPFLQPEETAGILGEHFARHDAPGIAALTGARDDSLAHNPPTAIDRGLGWVGGALTGTPWWALAACIALLSRFWPRVAVVVTGMLAVGLAIDWGVALVGLWGGQVLRAAWEWRRPAVGGARHGVLIGAGRLAADLGRVMVAFIAVVIVEGLAGAPLRDGLGNTGTLLAITLLFLVAWVAPRLPTGEGRRNVRIALERWSHHEYWPAWLFYTPLIPYLAYLTIRYRGPLTFTCCNPSIPFGGGFIGESKSDIMRRLGDSPRVLPTGLIPPGTVEGRVDAVRAFMESRRLSYPVILKPDAGQRGFGLRLARDEADVRAYLAEVTTPAVVQPYDPGPHECGVLWVRRLPPAPEGQAVGEVFSITRKEFPGVTGDGRRTIEALVFADRRLRRQARVFLERLGPRARDVPKAGERVVLAVAGNHCQGTLFRDGADLLTPELAAAIDRLASGFEGGLDVGRFDIRYADEGALRRGEGFAVLELNGTTSESTNVYDPRRSVLWAYGVVFGLWRQMYALGAWRRAQGARGASAWALLSAWLAFRRDRRGREVSD